MYVFSLSLYTYIYIYISIYIIWVSSPGDLPDALRRCRGSDALPDA